jgi:hypothetical protein
MNSLFIDGDIKNVNSELGDRSQRSSDGGPPNVYTFHTPRYAGSAIPPQPHTCRAITKLGTHPDSKFQRAYPVRSPTTPTVPRSRRTPFSVSVPIHLQPSLHTAYIKLYQAKLFTHHNSFSAPRRQRQGDHHQSTP